MYYVLKSLFYKIYFAYCSQRDVWERIPTTEQMISEHRLLLDERSMSDAHILK